jgi:Na+-transporting methylmalonyl-CoA/oxaloacetate decarboxylase gamma subunit
MRMRKVLKQLFKLAALGIGIILALLIVGIIYAVWYMKKDSRSPTETE